jgi:methanol metabolism-related c-type cytochrome
VNSAMFWRLAVVVALPLTFGAPWTAPKAAAQEAKPYRLVDGKVDFGTFNGFRRYHNACHVCHGPDGLGSSFGPALVDSLKRMNKDDFAAIVAQGKESEIGGVKLVMPSFGTDENVMLHLDDIYAYVKARSDGAIGRGRPERLEKGQ